MKYAVAVLLVALQLSSQLVGEQDGNSTKHGAEPTGANYQCIV